MSISSSQISGSQISGAPTGTAVSVPAVRNSFLPTPELPRFLSVFVVPSLLVTTLAGVLPVPIGKAALPPQVLTPPPALVQNADTTHGTPKTLTADSTKPFFVAPHFPPHPHRPGEWLNPDTTRGTPKTLTADATKPFFIVSPDLQIQHAQNEWLPLNTSAGTPKTLYADVLTPIGAQLGVEAAPPANWVLPDTSQSQPITLKVAIPPPPVIVAEQFYQLQHGINEWIPESTTAGTPKVLTVDSTQPFFIASPDLQVQHPGNEWLPENTSASSPLTLKVLPPFVLPEQFYQLQHGVQEWLPADTTRGSPTPLIRVDVTTPFFVLQPPVLDPVRPVWDTSHGTPIELIPPPQQPLPPGQQAWVGLQRFWFQPADTSVSTPIVQFLLSFTPGTATLWKRGQILNMSSTFTGQPGTAYLLKSGQIPSLTFLVPVTAGMDPEFYQLVAGRKWLETIDKRSWIETLPFRNWTVPYEDFPMSIGPKDPAETVVATLDFVQELQTGEVISSIASYVATVQSGTDPSPSAILSGSPSISGTQIRQTIIGGLEGVTYHLKTTINSSAGRVLVGATQLPVGLE